MSTEAANFKGEEINATIQAPETYLYQLFFELAWFGIYMENVYNDKLSAYIYARSLRQLRYMDIYLFHLPVENKESIVINHMHTEPISGGRRGGAEGRMHFSRFSYACAPFLFYFSPLHLRFLLLT